jgi:uncharacterized repeat protein (TIGR01451 family)
LFFPSLVSQENYENFPYPIHSILTAAYSEDPIGTTIPDVKLSIIQEFIKDQFPDIKYDLFATIQVQLLTPVPTKIGLASFPTQTLAATDIPTSSPFPTQTATLLSSPTITNIPLATPTATVPVIPTSTPPPTATQPSPDVVLTVKADSFSIDEPGGAITLTITITNNFNENLTIQNLSDSDLGDLNGVGTCGTAVVISPSNSYTCSYSDSISGNAGDVFNRTVNVLLQDQDANTVLKSDTVSIKILDVLPSSSVSVTANPASIEESGQPVTYLIDVTNTTVESITLVGLSANLGGDLNGMGSCATGGVIPVGGTYSCSFSGILSGNAGDVITNVITAEVEDDEANSATNVGGAEVTITDVLPSISVSLSAAPLVIGEGGELVDYSITITNSSVEEVTLTGLNAVFGGNLDGAGSCNLGVNIPVGGNYSCAFSTLITGNAGETIVNSVSADAQDDELNTTTGSSAASVSVTDVLPTIVVSVSPSPAVVTEPGGTVTYNVTVSNTSVEPVALTQLSDSIAGSLDGVGTCGLSGTIPSGAVYTCLFNMPVSGNAGDTITNTVTASVDDDEANTATNTGSATVTVTDVLPTIMVAVTPSSATVPEPGGTVTYTVTVDNTSVEAVTLNSLTDDINGDLNGQGTCTVPLAVGAGGSFTCNYSANLTGNPGDIITNTVTVIAEDNEGNITSNSGGTTVTITDVLPTITVTVTPSTATVSEPGATVTYTVTVNNTSVEGVSLTSLTDDVNGDLDGQGTCAVPQAIGVGGSYSCSFDAAVNGNAGDSTTNTVTASADDDEANTATDTGSATVTVTDVLPTITVTVTPSTATVSEPGATVTYSVTVNNTSVEPVSLTSLTDDVNGDLDGQGTCAVPQAIGLGGSYSCSFDAAVSGNAGASTTNTVTASADDDEANTATDTSSATVTVTDVLPTITVTMTPSGNSVPEPGATVTYTIQVDNTSVESVSLTSLIDDVNGDLNGQGTCVVPQAIGVSGSYICSFDAAVNGNAGASTTNTVTASADDDEVNTATDTGSATVTVNDVLPTFTTLKESSVSDVNEPGGNVTFTITLTNTSPEPVTLNALDDDQLGSLDGVGTCNIGGTIAIGGNYSCAYTVFVGGTAGDTYTNTVTAEVEDDEANTATRSDSVSVGVIPAEAVTLSGEVREDLDFDGDLGDTDLGIPGVTLELDDGTCMVGSTCITTLTAADGSYAFLNIMPGNYTIIEYDLPGYTSTNDADGTNDNQIALTVLSGVDISGNDFLDTIEFANIYGQVRDDSDGDGDLGDNDAGLEGVLIQLYDGICTLGVDCASTTTDQNGNYQFIDLLPGDYLVVETDPAGYMSTADSDLPNDNQIRVTIIRGLDSMDNVFLDTTEPASCIAPDPVNGYVTNTVPASGATVSITTSTLQVVFNQAMATVGGGSVEDPGHFDGKIANLTFGGDVPLLSAEYNVQTKTTTLTLDTSDPDWLPGSEYQITIKSGIQNGCGTNQGLDVLRNFFTQGAISGQVRNDIDGDGDLGDGDDGISDVTLELDNGVCTIGTDCLMTTTDANGDYRFDDLAAGSYIVHQTNLPGYASTADQDGGDPDQIAVVLGDHQYISQRDFLDLGSSCTAPLPVTGFVSGSNPTANEVISYNSTTLQITFNQAMSTGAGSVLDLGSFDNKIRNLTKGADVDLLAVSYDGDTQTVTLTVDTTDPDWLHGANYRIRVKSSIANACETSQGFDVDIPFSTMSAISGYVRNDLDADGDLGDGDKGIYGAIIELQDSSCILGISCSKTTTDIEGHYEFTDLPAGNYIIHQTDLPGYSSTVDVDGGDSNQISVTLGAVENIVDLIFLDTATSCIPADPFTGYVSSTIPADNQTMVSMSTNSIKIKFNQPMYTDGGGSVLDMGNYHNNIDNLDLGGDVSYTAIDYDPNTYTVTLTLDTSDSSWTPGSWFEIRIDNSIENACKTDQSVEVRPVFQTTSSISGQVRLDDDSDGDIADPDPGITGVTVELSDGVCTVGVDCLTTTTNANGFYIFPYIAPGNYTIFEYNLPGYTSTADTQGANDDQITVTLLPGVISTRNDFLDAGP